MFSLPVARSYAHALRLCLTSGVETASRVGGMDSSDVGRTKELRDFVYEWTPGDEVFRPGYSRKLALTEALHLLSGTFDEAHFRAVAPKVGSGFFTAQMAYGPRCQPQYERVSIELRDNPHSRRAVLFVSDNGSWPPPCTNNFQWLVREGRLEMVVTMRSWDLWLGLPYDTFMFGALHLAMAGALGLPLGRARVLAASAHLYEKHWDQVRGAFANDSMGNRMAAYDVASRTWPRFAGPGEHLELYWIEMKSWAEGDLDWLPWSDPETWAAAQKSGLVRFK